MSSNFCRLPVPIRLNQCPNEAAKERVYQHRTEGNENLDKAGQLLKLFTDDTIAQQTPFHRVRARAFSILQRDQIDFVADHITREVKFDETAFRWEHIDDLAQQFKLNLRPILMPVDWAVSSGQTSLIKAVDFLKDAFGKGRSLRQYALEGFPLQVIPETAKRYLYNPNPTGQRPLLPDRYEFLVYRLVRNGLEAGDVFCRDSVRFRSFDDDLIDDERWQHKDQLIADTGSAILKQPIREHLAELEQRLERRFVEVNERIASGENQHFKIKKQGDKVRWTLPYP